MPPRGKGCCEAGVLQQAATGQCQMLPEGAGGPVPCGHCRQSWASSNKIEMGRDTRNVLYWQGVI